MLSVGFNYYIIILCTIFALKFVILIYVRENICSSVFLSWIISCLSNFCHLTLIVVISDRKQYNLKHRCSQSTRWLPFVFLLSGSTTGFNVLKLYVYDSNCGSHNPIPKWLLRRVLALWKHSNDLPSSEKSKCSSPSMVFFISALMA